MKVIRLKRCKTAWKLIRREFFTPGTVPDKAYIKALNLIEHTTRRYYRRVAQKALNRGEMINFKYYSHTAESPFLMEDNMTAALEYWERRYPKRAALAQAIRDRKWTEKIAAENIDLFQYTL